jgi:hypothetical protein
LTKLNVEIALVLIIVSVFIPLFSISSNHALSNFNTYVTDDEIVITTDNYNLTISRSGGRIISWSLDSLNLVGSAGMRGDLGISNPLWDWLLSESWPGTLSKIYYDFVNVDAERNSVLMSTSVEVLGTILKITREYIFNDSWGFYLIVTLTNEGSSILKSNVNWDIPGLGYGMALTTGIGESIADDSQVWLINDILEFRSPEERANWVRYEGNVEFVGIIGMDDGAGIFLFPLNDTKALWAEASSWGTELRVEYPTLLLSPGKQISYLFKVVALPVDKELFDNYGLGEAYSYVYSSGVSTIKIYVDLSSPAYLVNEKIVCNVTLYSEESIPLTLELSILRGATAVHTFNESLTIGPGSTEFNVTFPGLPNEGRYIISVKAFRNNELVGNYKEEFYVLSEGTSFDVAFVWHHHQAPNYFPNGTFHGTWAFRHTYEDEFAPFYEGGAYYVHASILSKYPDVKMTYHLSPSLLQQWDIAINEGWCEIGGKCYSSDLPEAGMIREALDMYRNLLSKGQVEVLTSYFAHPIAGYIADKYGWMDLLKLDLLWGLNVTREVMDYDPIGMWSPEMAFSNKLVYLINSTGLRYTVLDGNCHFGGALGEKDDIYITYRLVYNGSEIYLVFRDAGLSNVIGFQNVFQNEFMARKKAREFARSLVDIALRKGGEGVATIALDGENWMIFSPTQEYTAVYLEELIRSLHELQSRGLLKTVTLEEAFRDYPPERTLTSVPSTSWLCSWSKWTTERGDQQRRQWALVNQTYQVIMDYVSKYGYDETYYDALKALIYAVDSDFYWAEFAWEPHVREWSLHAIAIIEEAISSKITTTMPTTITSPTTTTPSPTTTTTTTTTITTATPPPAISDYWYGVLAILILIVAFIIVNKRYRWFSH